MNCNQKRQLAQCLLMGGYEEVALNPGFRYRPGGRGS